MLSMNHEDFLTYAASHGFGELHFKIDKESGMKAIIAIHSTKLGPALGGCRFIRYSDSFAAIFDAMRLARGMSYKAALVNLSLGGGKAVILYPETPFDRQAYMHAFGKFVNELGGRYITALDSGTNLNDMDIIGEQTPYVASLSKQNGDPAPYTAKGVLKGIEASVAFKLKRTSLEGLHVAIQGLGHVGYELARLLSELGVRLTVSDVVMSHCDKAASEFGVTVVPPEEIHRIKCDVFAPCALGGVINETTLSQFNTPIIAGAANNQLEHSYHAERLKEKNILYAPDYVLNAGGVIFAASHYYKTSLEEVNNQINHIYDTLLNIFEQAMIHNLSTADVADKIARERLE